MDGDNKKVLIDELEGNSFNYVHGRLSVTASSFNEEVMGPEYICPLDNSNGIYSLKAKKTVVIVDGRHRTVVIQDLSKLVSGYEYNWTRDKLRVTIMRMSGTDTKHSQSWEIIKLRLPRNISGEKNRKYIFLDLLNSVVHDSSEFTEEYGFSFLEAKNVKTGHDLMKSNFMDRKIKDTYMRDTHVLQLFFQNHILLNVLEG